MLANLALSFSILSGIMACFLFFIGLTSSEKKKTRMLLLWACFFLASSFAGLEWAFWLEGYNLFELISEFTFPLIVYFGVWFAFIIWLFELRKERLIWIILLILLIIVTLVAINCMNCMIV